MANPGEAEGRKKRSQSKEGNYACPSLSSALGRIRQASKERKLQFTSLWHHVYEVDHLRWAYNQLKRNASAGVDGKTWKSYGEELEANLGELSSRLAKGAFRAQPVARRYIPKVDGRQRPIGIPALEDKIVQRITVEVLNAIYETDFRNFSYGFRPKRNQHNALDALWVGLIRRKVNWVLDADIRGFFDAINHDMLLKFVEHRIRDGRVLRHIRRWLNAGVMEEGKVWQQERGTPQGGVISPLLANIYLHYTFDLWIEWWRKRQARGDVIVVRYADDFVIGFQHHDEAHRCMRELRERLGCFELELHTDKTRLIEFGRFAASNRRERGKRKPETFDFLGFTHSCGQTLKGRFTIVRHTVRSRMRKKCQEIKAELHKRINESIVVTGQWLRAVVQGHMNYYSVPCNISCIRAFCSRVVHMWKRVLNRRSHKEHTSWERMRRLRGLWIPKPAVVHPYPDARLTV